MSEEIPVKKPTPSRGGPFFFIVIMVLLLVIGLVWYVWF